MNLRHTLLTALPLGLLGALPLAAQSATLIADLNTATLAENSNPAEWTPIGSQWLFAASNRQDGRELWITDGTPAGTRLFFEVDPGPGGDVRMLHALDAGRVLFYGAGAMWVTDGTAGGTTRIGTVEPILYPTQRPDGSVVYFQGRTAAEGDELWVTDGTPAGTQLVGDLRPGSSSSDPAQILSVEYFDSTLRGLTLYTFFSADTPNFGRELWLLREGNLERLTDMDPGVRDGILPVGDFAVFAPTAPSPFSNGLTLWFTGTSPQTGTELFRYFQAFSTYTGRIGLVEDINPGSGSSTPRELTARSANVLFSAFGELWEASALTNDATLVADLNASASSNPDNFLYAPQINPFLRPVYFTALDPTLGRCIYVADIFGVQFVADPVIGFNTGGIQLLTASNRLVYFEGFDATNGSELWSTDGTRAGTRLVYNVKSGADSGQPREAVVDFNVAGEPRVLFSAEGRGRSGREPHSYNETTLQGRPIADIQPFVGQPSNPRHFAEALDGSAWFVADPQFGRSEMFRTDGTTAGTEELFRTHPLDPRNPTAPIVSDDGRVWFNADRGINQRNLLVAQSSSSLSVVNIANQIGDATEITPLANGVAASVPILLRGNELFVDGTVFDVRPGLDGSDPRWLTRCGDVLFFTATDASGDRELWRVNWKTRSQLFQVANINANGSSNPAHLIAYRNVLYFTANDGVHGRELWRSSGVGNGTFLVSDFNPGGADGIPGELVTAGALLFFFGDDGSHGLEPCRSNGTSSGTQMISDVRPGAAGCDPRELTVVHPDRIAMVADDGIHGQEPWLVTTTAATVRDLVPGANGSDPRSLVWSSRSLFFSAASPGSGRELWSLDGIDLQNPQQLGEVGPGSSSGLAANAEFSFAKRMLVFPGDDGIEGNELWGYDTNGLIRALPGRCAAELTEQRLRGFGPSLGQAIQLNGFGAPNTPGTFALFLIDAQPPAPAPFGPHCQLHLNPATMFAFAAIPTTGQFVSVLPLPNINGVPGATVRVQCAIIPGRGAFGIDLTNAIEVRVGI